MFRRRTAPGLGDLDLERNRLRAAGGQRARNRRAVGNGDDVAARAHGGDAVLVVGLERGRRQHEARERFAARRDLDAREVDGGIGPP